MRTFKLTTLLFVLAALVVLPGCGGGADDAKSATVSEPSPVAEEAAEAAPAEVMAETEPVTDVEPPAEESTPAAEGAMAAAYVIEPNDASSIMFTGYKPLGSQEGGFSLFTGSVSAPEGKIENLKADVTIDVTSLFSESDTLTEVLKTSDFFHAEAHPEATFVVTGVKAADGGYTVNGNLTMLGVEKGVSFPADIEISDDGVSLSAEFKIDRSQWGMSTAGWKDSLINNDVLINLDVLATPAE